MRNTAGIFGAILLPLAIQGSAIAAEPVGNNLVGTWQCHNPVIVQDHDVLARNVDYQLYVFEQIHQTFLGYYELDLSVLGLGADARPAMDAIDGMSTRETADGAIILRSNFTGVIGPDPDRFYVIDHIPDAFKVGKIDSSEHLSYVVMGFGGKAAAHSGYCIRTSRETPAP